VRSRAALCEICGGQRGIVTGVAPGASSTHYCYQKDKRAKHENFQNSDALSEIGQHDDTGKFFHFGLQRMLTWGSSPSRF
jgi:hypothetical protein